MLRLRLYCAFSIDDDGRTDDGQVASDNWFSVPPPLAPTAAAARSVGLSLISLPLPLSLPPSLSAPLSSHSVISQITERQLYGAITAAQTEAEVGAQQIATLGAERERLQQRLAALEQATLN